MKLLFVLENYLPHIGGVEIVFKHLCEGLAKKGHDVNIVTHQLKNTKKYEVLNGVKIHRVACFGNRYLFSFLAIPKAWKLAKDADLIHTTTYNGAVPTRFASKFLKKPAVITVHEILGDNWNLFEMGWLSAKLHKFLEKRVVSLKFDAYVSVSNSTQECVLEDGIDKDKAVVIYNGVDYDFFNPEKYDGDKVRKELGIEDNFVYFFYGRPGVSKGLEYLIRAVPIISKNIPNSKFVAIVSRDKAYEKRFNNILKLIETLGVKDQIILLKPMPRYDLPNYIKAADCVVVPSLTEGFGFTAAESCAMGKAVVASNTTSLPEVVSGRYMLVKPRDSEDIAKGVIGVFKNKITETKMKIFKWEDNIEAYIKLYDELIRC